MRVCPQCKLDVSGGLSGCPHHGDPKACPIAAEAGAAPAAEQPGTGTLDPATHQVPPPAPPKKNGKKGKNGGGKTPPASPVGGATLDLPAQPASAGATPPTGSGTAFMETLAPEEAGAGAQPSSDPNTDHLKTLPMSAAPSAGTPGDTAGTLPYGSSLEAAAAGGSGDGASGSAGRLKRLWDGAAGSSQNPMHSMGGAGQASDSVFDRVAKRVVAGDVDGLSPAPADRLTDYLVIEKLGSGSMGIVYAAKQTGIGRVVALKVMKDVRLDEEGAADAGATTGARHMTVEVAAAEQDRHRRAAVRRKKQQATQSRRQLSFFYEAQITGDLNHPNIVPIYELGISQDGMLFYSMKQIIGTEWQDAIASKTRDENVDVLMKVADAVAFAHSRGVIHRDLKPQNTMLGPYGEVLVTDWGLAVKPEQDRTFGLGGSPAYMAPEMAGHEIDRIGAASDIYLLGAILFQVVTGHPPHTGQTLTECCTNAYRNEIIPVQISDPLLDIAYRAMQSDPVDRYPSVESMQDAIREYRRHAQSILLAERAIDQLRDALKTKNYEQFSRTIFGFQDAVDLWPANRAATEGLAQARFAYGQCAFDKGDFDLCLQTLNQQVPNEAALYREAVKAKAEADSRGMRFKRLRKVLAAVILGALVGMSGLFGLAAWKWRDAVVNANEAKKQTGIAETNLETANEQRKLAETNERTANEQRELALNNERTANEQRTLAETNARIANEQRELALSNERTANEQRTLAETNETKAIEQRALAQNRAAQIELQNYSANLALAKIQLEQADIARGADLLGDLVNPAKYETMTSQGRLPKFDNWAIRRAGLLGNLDLPRLGLGGKVTALDSLASAPRGVAGLADGRLVFWRLVMKSTGENTSEPVLEAESATDANWPIKAAIDSIALSPTGDEVVFSVATAGEESTVYSWKPDSTAAPVALRAAERRAIQGLVMTGRHLIAGLNGGLLVWDRTSSGWETRDPEAIRQVRGRLRSMQLAGENRLLVVAELNGRLNLHDIRLDGSEPRTLKLADDIASELSAAAWLPSGETLVLGLRDGRLLSASLSGDAVDETRELLPRRHSSAVRSIRVHNDGSLLTTGEERVVQVWRRSESSLAGWEHEQQLAGTRDNVGSVAFAGTASAVLAIGADGQALIWETGRQQQRRRLERVNPDATAGAEIAPVVATFFPAGTSEAISIDRNGVIGHWNIDDGTVLSVGENGPFDFTGHTPGSSLLDAVLDETAGVLVTVAALPQAGQAEAGYVLTVEGKEHEFCQWDLATGRMASRWYGPASPGRRLSLFEKGQSLMVSGNASALTAYTLTGQSSRLQNQNFSSALLACPNPAEPEQLMLVASTGALRLLDRAGNELAISSDLYPDKLDVLQAAWTPDGQRFLVLQQKGSLAVFTVAAGKLSPARVYGFDVTTPTEHWNVDLLAGSGDAGETAAIAVREGSGQTGGTTRLFNVLFASEPATGIKADRTVDGHQYLVHGTDGSPAFFSGAVAAVVEGDGNLRGVLRGNQSVWVATTSGNLRGLDQSLQDQEPLGRPTIVAATASAAGNRLLALSTAGDLWRADRSGQGSGWAWTRLSATAAAGSRIELSGDGQQLLVTETGAGAGSVRVLSAESGEPVRELDSLVVASWVPGSPGQLAAIAADGSVSRIDIASGESAAIGSVDLAGRTPGQLHWLNEAWADGSTDQWLVAQSNAAGGADRLDYLLFMAAAGDAAGETRTRAVQLEIPAGARLAFSPTEAIFALGDGGSVSIRFAAPGLGEPNAPLFDLAGHAGADVVFLGFSPDGNTLVTADNQSRQFGWMSVDRMKGIPPTSALARQARPEPELTTTASRGQ